MKNLFDGFVIVFEVSQQAQSNGFSREKTC